MKNSEKLQKRKRAVAAGWGFCGLLLFFAVGNVLGKDKSFSEMENRMLAQRPPLKAEQIFSGRYGEKFETYYNDQFVFRDFWIKTKAGFDRITGKVESNGVYLGKDGYLMEKFTAPDKENLERLYEAIADFSEKHEELKQYALIVPNAENILSDKLPAFALSVDQNAYIDEMEEKLGGENITFVDVRSIMEKHKEEKIYYQTDHHWTTKAAYYAFLEAGDVMGYDAEEVTFQELPVTDDFQGTLSAKSGFRTGKKEKLEIFLPEDENIRSVVSFVDEQKKTGSFYDTSKLDTRDGYACFFGGNHSLIRIQTPVEENRRILVLKDSYANCFLPFLATRYRDIVVVDPRYYYGDLEELMQVENVQEILYLYNANTFFNDTALASVLSGES